MDLTECPESLGIAKIPVSRLAKKLRSSMWLRGFYEPSRFHEITMACSLKDQGPSKIRD